MKRHPRLAHFPHLLPIQIAWLPDIGGIKKEVGSQSGLEKERKRLLVIRTAAALLGNLVVQKYRSPFDRRPGMSNRLAAYGTRCHTPSSRLVKQRNIPTRKATFIIRRK